MIMSHETMEDITFCTSFITLCEMRISIGQSLPSRINSDVVENVCQQRARNGDNTNPTYLQYCKNINTITLSQNSKSKSKKSNAGMKGAMPYGFTKPTKLMTK